MGCVPSNSKSSSSTVHDPPERAPPLSRIERPEVALPACELHQQEKAALSTEEPITAPTVVQPGPPVTAREVEIVSESKSSCPSTAVEDSTNAAATSSQEQLLDFDAFMKFQEVQNVLEEKSVSKDTLLELFNIVDKDSDGYVTDKEREDLLELISLSYGEKSAKHQSSKLKNYTSENQKGDAANKCDNFEDESTTEHYSETLPVPTVTDATKEATAVAHTGTNNTTCSNNNGDNSAATTEGGGPSKSRAGRAKPKIIRFISPQLTESLPAPLQQPTQLSQAQRAASLPLEANTSSKSMASTKSADDVSSYNSDRPSPVQKKGFMITKRESFDKSEIFSPSQSRFFMLENGCLSYMDSTSKKPPFSINHREIKLTGVEITVNKNVIELAPRRPLSLSMNGQSGSEKDDVGEIVVLELKSEAECAEWMRAIQEHLTFSNSNSSSIE